MTSTHLVGTEPPYDQSRRSAAAAEAHPRARRGGTTGRIRWTADNLRRLVGVVLVSLVALSTLALCGRTAATTDVSTPRGAASTYFAAMQQGDAAAADAVTCDHLDERYAVPMDRLVEEAFAGQPPSARGFVLGPRLDSGVEYEFPVALPGALLARAVIRYDADSGTYEFCGLDEVRVWEVD